MKKLILFVSVCAIIFCSLGGTEMGSVSCTGKNCSRGTGWVECDGIKTRC